MLEIVWQYDPHKPVAETPRSAAEARERLAGGNAIFADLTDQATLDKGMQRAVIPVAARELGVTSPPGQAPAQDPFVAILGCADARVPAELIFGLQANQAFVVRVAGNVLSNETLGSLEFAVTNLSAVQLLVVLGHTDCGAISAAVDAFLKPHSLLEAPTSPPLRAIVDSLMVPAQAATKALTAVHGAGVAEHPAYRTAVIEIAVALNAALVARSTAHALSPALRADLEVVFGVYDLGRRRVGLPGLDDAGQSWQSGLFTPPADETAFHELGRALASSTTVRAILN